MKKFSIVFLILMLIAVPVLASDDSSDYSFFDTVLEFAQAALDILNDILKIIATLSLDLIPAFCKLLIAIFAYVGKLIKYVVFFAKIPAVAIPQKGVMCGVNQILHFQVYGTTLFGAVTNVLSFIVGFKLVKRLVL